MLYTTEQVAHMSGVGTNTVLKCMHSGMIDGCQIRSTKTGRNQYFFNEAAIEVLKNRYYTTDEPGSTLKQKGENYNAIELASLLGVTPSAITSFVKRGLLKGSKSKQKIDGRGTKFRWEFTENDINKFLERLTKVPNIDVTDLNCKAIQEMILDYKHGNGYWIVHSNNLSSGICSNCGNSAINGSTNSLTGEREVLDFNFCPHCGKKMIKVYTYS